MPVVKLKNKIDRTQITLNRYHVKTSEKSIPHANFNFWFTDDLSKWTGKPKGKKSKPLF